MITKELTPKNGKIHVTQGAHIAIAKQTMPRDDAELAVAEYFRKYSRSDAHNIDRDIRDILEVVNLLPTPPKDSDLTKEQVFTSFLERKIHSFS